MMGIAVPGPNMSNAQIGFMYAISLGIAIAVWALSALIMGGNVTSNVRAGFFVGLLMVAFQEGHRQGQRSGE